MLTSIGRDSRKLESGSAPASAPLDWEVVEHLEALGDGRYRAWDDLAVACGRPFCAPGWLLPWWRNVARPGARLHVALAKDSDEVVGVAPFYVEPRRRGGLTILRPLGARTCQRVEPLAAPGRDPEVAVALAAAMASARPDAVSFEGIPAGTPWPALVREAWPSRRTPSVHPMGTGTALTIDVTGQDFDAWFMSKTSHFRQRLRKSGKELAKRGGEARIATPETLQRDLEAFIRLHRARWAPRGEINPVTPPVESMLREVGRELPAGDRIRVWSLDVGGETIASSVLLAAGGEIAYWLNAFDEEHGSFSPSRLAILTVIEDAFSGGFDRLDLGAGVLEYKQRFAEDQERLEWLWLVPSGVRRPLVRLAPAAMRIRTRASARLSPATKAALKGIARRARGA